MTRALRCIVVSFGIVCFFPLSTARAANSLAFDVKIHAGQHDRTNVPVSVPIELPADAKNSTVAEIAVPGERRLSASCRRRASALRLRRRPPVHSERNCTLSFPN